MPKLNFSLTLVSLVVMGVMGLVKQAGSDLPESEVREWVLTTFQILAALGVWVGRLRAGGVKWYGVKN